MKPVLDKLPNIMLIAIFRAPSNGCFKIYFTSDLFYIYFFLKSHVTLLTKHIFSFFIWLIFEL